MHNVIPVLCTGELYVHTFLGLARYPSPHLLELGGDAELQLPISSFPLITNLDSAKCGLFPWGMLPGYAPSGVGDLVTVFSSYAKLFCLQMAVGKDQL